VSTNKDPSAGRKGLGRLEVAHLRIDRAVARSSAWLHNDTFGRWLITEAISQLATEVETVLTIPSKDDERKRWKSEPVDSMRLRLIRLENSDLARSKRQAIETIVALGAFAHNSDTAAFQVNEPNTRAMIRLHLTQPDRTLTACMAAKSIGESGLLIGSTLFTTDSSKGFPEGLTQQTVEITTEAVLSRTNLIYLGQA
jgi:hypothetical protein